MNFLRRIKIRNRLILIFLLVSVIPIILIGYFSYNIYSESIVKKLNRSTQQTVDQIQKNLLQEIQTYQYISGMITTNRVIQDCLRQPATSYHLYADTARTEMNRLTYQSYMINVRIVNTQGSLLYDLGYASIADAQEAKLIADTEARVPSDSWSYIRTLRKNDIIVMGRQINDLYHFEKGLGYVFVYLDEKLFSSDILGDVDLGAGSSLLLLSATGEVLSSSEKSVPRGTGYVDADLINALHKNSAAQPSKKSRTFEHSFGASQETIAYSFVEDINCYLVAKVPYSYIYSETETIRQTMLALIVIIVTICIALIIWLYASIVNPVLMIVRNCVATASGTLSIRNHDSSNDEIGFLSNNIDMMVDKIEQLMAQQKLDQKKKRSLELQMLQYQINPHFLFNTLNTLKWIAVLNKVHILSNGIGALSDLLRSTIVNSDEYITVKDELDNLASYFEIQKMRYADCFEVVYEIDDCVLNKKVPKFILQPIAENSIIHGIDEDNIVITIRCYEEADHLIIELEDNGKGFDPTKADLSASKKVTGVGVNNVNELLKLSFGSEYGLAITSEIGKGTLCHIVVPSEFEEGVSNV